VRDTFPPHEIVLPNYEIKLAISCLNKLAGDAGRGKVSRVTATCLSGKPPKSWQIIFTFSIVPLNILFGIEHRIADGCRSSGNVAGSSFQLAS
jgi:hypothetical protein